MSRLAAFHAQTPPPLPPDTDALAQALFDLALHRLSSDPCYVAHARMLAQLQEVVAQLQAATQELSEEVRRHV